MTEAQTAEKGRGLLFFWILPFAGKTIKMKAMPTVIKVMGAAVALLGLLAKLQGLRSAPAEAFFSGFDYVVLVVGLALTILGFAFTFFMSGEAEEPSRSRGPDSKSKSSPAA